MIRGRPAGIVVAAAAAVALLTLGIWELVHGLEGDNFGSDVNPQINTVIGAVFLAGGVMCAAITVAGALRRRP